MVVALLLLTLLLCCLRRRVIAARVARRKEWFRSAPSGGVTYLDKDAFGGADAMGGSGSRSARSSFATSYDRGLLATPDPSTFSDPPPLVEPAHQGWTAQLAGAPVTFPAASHPTESFTAATVRNGGDRSSVSSTASSLSAETTRFQDQFLIAVPPGATLHGGESPVPSPIPSPFSVRPFSPSERWSFPKPPSARASVADKHTSSSGLLSVKSTFADASPAENPFADFTEIAAAITVRPDTAHSDASSALSSRFETVETIRRQFLPSMEDEMAVTAGEEVRILRRFDDGWAVAEKVATGAQGLIPIDCLRAPEEELPAFLAKKRISSYRGGISMRASATSTIGAAM